MKLFSRFALTLLTAATALIFSGCNDDESNVLGLNESAKYGYIKLTFDGIRPDGIPFKVTKKYRYITGFGPAGSSTHIIEDEDGVITHEFRATRLNDPFDSSPRSANITINAIEENGELELTQSTFNASSSLTFDDQTAFILTTYWGPLDPEDMAYSYNEDTGKFKIKFQTVVLAEDNTSDHDLTVTGEASVILFKPLD